MSVQNNTNTAATHRSCSHQRSHEEVEFERHFNTLKNNAAVFDNGNPFACSKNDQKIGREDLAWLSNHHDPQIKKAAKYFMNNAVAWQKLDAAGDGKSDSLISFDNIVSMDDKLKAEAQKRTEEAKKAEEAKKSQSPAPNQGSSDSFEPKKQEGAPQTEAPKRPGCGGGYREKTIKATEHALQTLSSVLNALQMAQNGGSTATGPQIKESLKQIAQDPNTPQGIKDLLNKVINHPMFEKAFAPKPNVGQGTAPSLTTPQPNQLPKITLPSIPNVLTPITSSQPSAPNSSVSGQYGEGTISKAQYEKFDQLNKNLDDAKATYEKEPNEKNMMKYKEAMQQKEQMFQFMMSLFAHQDKMFQSFIQNLR